MARLKTVGFEQRDLTTNSEIFFAFGDPQLVTNINSDSNIATVWDDLTQEWDSVDVTWNDVGSGVEYDPNLVRSGFYALKMGINQSFDVKASTKGGGGYMRMFIKLITLPDGISSMILFISEDEVARATLEMQTDGRLRLKYINDTEDEAYLGDYSSPLKLDQWYMIEMGIIGDESGTDRYFECRIDGQPFVQANVDDQSSYDGYFAAATNYDNDAATVFDFAVDDVATNDGNTYDYDQSNNTWCGNGKVVVLPVTGNDDLTENAGFTRGGEDTGSDWGQIAEVSPPSDGDSYLSTTSDSAIVEARVYNPYLLGLRAADTIKVVVANARFKMATDTDDGDAYVYVRAGSNLPKMGKEINLVGEDWITGDGFGNALDTFDCDRLPETTNPWKVEHVASMRVGLEMVSLTGTLELGGLWAVIEYNPYEAKDYSVKIGGVDRTADVRNRSLSISDRLNEVADTATFDLYDLHTHGMPSTNDEVIITRNGIRLFAGNILTVTASNISNAEQYFSIKAIDYTRKLDRRLVAATFTNKTDKEIIETIITQYAAGENIDTYFVAETTTIAQISFNYVYVSNAIQQIADLTGCNWYIDYFGSLHYHRTQESQSLFDITATGNKHQALKITKDGQKLRNRVFVRGGTTLTTSPITENIVADGEQRVFLLAEKPHDVTVTVNSVPQTVGIKNIDSADDYDWLLSFQEKYLEAGTSTTTPSEGAIFSVSYNYDVPILVSVEDSDSIAAEGGVFEYPIIDKQITTSEQAVNRAIAELTDYAADMVSGSYSTEELGLRSGQYQRVTFANKSVDSDYIIDSVTYKSLGGGKFITDVTLTSAKQLGIIRFLIKLLQMNRQVGEFDPNEQVDQLLTLTDSIPTLLDSLIEDSAGLTFKYSNDEGTTPNKAQYDLSSYS